MTIKQEHLSFLDELRESGVTNMFGAGQYIQKEFNVDKESAKKILLHWMDNFNVTGTKLKGKSYESNSD